MRPRLIEQVPHLLARQHFARVRGLYPARQDVDEPVPAVDGLGKLRTSGQYRRQTD